MPDQPIAINGYLPPQMNLEALNQLLRSVPWERNGETIYPEARLLSQKDAVSMKSLLINMLIMFIASLILISGLINFVREVTVCLKFQQIVFYYIYHSDTLYGTIRLQTRFGEDVCTVGILVTICLADKIL